MLLWCPRGYLEPGYGMLEDSLALHLAPYLVVGCLSVSILDVHASAISQQDFNTLGEAHAGGQMKRSLE